MNSWSSLLNDKVVFIAGGAGWIGQHIAKTCYEHGARVVVADRDIQLMENMVFSAFPLEISNERLFLVQIDLQTKSTLEKAITLVMRKWTTIDVLINAAAIFPLGLIEDVSAVDWSDVINVNVAGYALMTEQIVPVFKEKNRGCIINLASAAGLIAIPSFLPYAVSKSAIIHLSRSLAFDLGSHNIRVNSISPAAIDSPTLFRTASESGLTKEEFDREHIGKCIRRLGHPQEIANLVVFLASDLCCFITGENIVVDGGFTIV